MIIFNKTFLLGSWFSSWALSNFISFCFILFCFILFLSILFYFISSIDFIQIHYCWCMLYLLHFMISYVLRLRTSDHQTHCPLVCVFLLWSINTSISLSHVRCSILFLSAFLFFRHQALTF